ncbi:hypothetical protein P170DRAFT_385593, partial [Aspergillus steynii IBT 23096]
MESEFWRRESLRRRVRALILAGRAKQRQIPSGEGNEQESDPTASYVMSDHDRQCLESLRAIDPELQKHDIQAAQGDLLKHSPRRFLEDPAVRQWKDSQKAHILWIRGDPGMGKTPLVCGIIDELKATMNNTNISFFFCQALETRANNATAVLRGLTYMLVQKHPSLITHIGNSSFERENAWFALLRAFTDILKDLRSTYLIIDALDECTKDLPRLLHLIQKSSAYPHVKWIVSSRNHLSIMDDLDDTTKIISIELKSDTPSADISSYIEQKTDVLAKKNNYSPQLKDTVQDYLMSNANKTFLWVAMTCKMLTSVPEPLVEKTLDGFAQSLEAIYAQILEQIIESDDSELCKSILRI